MTRGDEDRWPPLPWETWKDTCETLHMWMQIAGKVKLELAPFLNEWWEVAFHLTARGMTTGIIPYRDRTFDMNFDFIDHHVSIRTDDGALETLRLEPRSVADFYREFMGALTAVGLEVTINPVPSEVQEPIPFDENRKDSSYDAAMVNRWWRIQVQTAKVLQRYRSSFVGKSSPILFYWGGFDLSHARFSGRPAPVQQDMPRFFQIAEDQENIACGFWPGNPNASGRTLGEPAFYSYISPAPRGYEVATVRPQSASFDTIMGEYILRYQDVRQSDTPEEDLLAFFQSTYEAGADLAEWDRRALESCVPPS